MILPTAQGAKILERRMLHFGDELPAQRMATHAGLVCDACQRLGTLPRPGENGEPDVEALRRLGVALGGGDWSRRDYAAMRELYFGEPMKFETVLGKLAEFEDRVHTLSAVTYLPPA